METRTIENFCGALDLHNGGRTVPPPGSSADWAIRLAETYDRDPVLWGLVCKYRREGRPLPRHFGTVLALVN